MADINRRWIMTRRPEGDDFASALDLVAGPMPVPGEGEVVIRNVFLSLDAGTRSYMSARTDSYLPPLPPGSSVPSMLVGEVTASRHPDYRPGDLVRGFGQWADYSVARPDETFLSRVSWRLDDLRQYLGVLGSNGWTAYGGIVDCGRAKAGETVVVSAAAGATGLMAGQIAKALGCRVVGIAGSDEKCRWITGEYGFDEAINYKTEAVEDRLRQLCPDGVQLYFENVGGAILDAVLPNMAQYGRVAVCGLLANYGKTGPVPGPLKFDMVLVKRLRIEGFFSPDWFHRGPDIDTHMAPWYRSGQVRLPFDLSQGLETTVTAYARLFTGANLGKVVVQVSEPRPTSPS
jgi:NADPH-dependent curcumin reductase CurA